MLRQSLLLWAGGHLTLYTVYRTSPGLVETQHFHIACLYDGSTAGFKGSVAFPSACTVLQSTDGTNGVVKFHCKDDFLSLKEFEKLLPFSRRRDAT